jgi:hypothetical protein
VILYGRAGRLAAQYGGSRPGQWWLYVVILVGIFFGFRLLAMVALTKKARGFALA